MMGSFLQVLAAVAVIIVPLLEYATSIESIVKDG